MFQHDILKGLIPHSHRFCMIPKICTNFFFLDKSLPRMPAHLNVQFTGALPWPRPTYLLTVCKQSLSSCPPPLELDSCPSSANNQALRILIHQCFHDSVPLLRQTGGLVRCSSLREKTNKFLWRNFEGGSDNSNMKTSPLCSLMH